MLVLAGTTRSGKVTPFCIRRNYEAVETTFPADPSPQVKRVTEWKIIAAEDNSKRRLADLPAAA